MAAPRPPVYAEPDLVVRRDPALADEAPPVVQRDPAPVDEAPPAVRRDHPRETAPEIEVITHDLEVIETGAFARAVCRGCAWQGPARRSRAIAVADSARHP